MSRYIDADVILTRLQTRLEFFPYDSVIEDFINSLTYWINQEKSKDVAPVVHAEWKVNEHIELDFCSNCLEPVRRYVTAGQMDRSNYKGETFWNYCPHCGAKMDGKEGKE